jgi:hypothetical protein
LPIGTTSALCFFFFNCCTGWGYIVAFTTVPTIYQIYHHWIHPLHHSPLSSPPPIPAVVSTGLIFPFTYMHTQYLHYIHPPTPFLHLLCFPLVSTSPDRTCSNLLFCDFVKEK